MFRPKLLTNQVILALFMGMALILLPLFLPVVKAEGRNMAPPISRPASEEKVPEEEPGGSDASESESTTVPVRVTQVA